MMSSIKNSLSVLLLLIAMVVHGQDRFVQVGNDSVSIFLEEDGKGNPVIFIPGWTMTTKFFKNQRNFFKEKFRYISYDPRGQGKSEKTKRGNTYATHADDLHGIIKTMGLKNVVLVGWSSGCATIFEYAKIYGVDNLSRLVFIDEPPKWIGDSEEEWVYGTFEDYRGSLKSLITDHDAYLNGIVDWMLVKQVAPQEKEWMIHQMKMTPKAIALNLYIDGLVSDYNNIVRTLNGKVPMLFMVRESWYPRVKKWLQKNADKSKITPIQSHAVFWERPEIFNSDLQTFLLTKF